MMLSGPPKSHVVAHLTVTWYTSGCFACAAWCAGNPVCRVARPFTRVLCNLKGMPIMSTRTTLLSVRPCLTEDTQQAYLKRKIVAQHCLQVIRFLCLHSIERAQAAC